MSKLMSLQEFFDNELKLSGQRLSNAPKDERDFRKMKWPNGYIWFTIPVNSEAESVLESTYTGCLWNDGRQVTQTINTRDEGEWLCYYLHTGPKISPEVHLAGMPTKDRIYLKGEKVCLTGGSIVLNTVCEELFSNREAGIMSFPIDTDGYEAMDIEERRLIGDSNPWLDGSFERKSRGLEVRGLNFADRGNVLEAVLWTSEGKELTECHEIWPEFIVPFENAKVQVKTNGDEETNDCYDGTREHPYRIVLP